MLASNTNMWIVKPIDDKKVIICLFEQLKCFIIFIEKVNLYFDIESCIYGGGQWKYTYGVTTQDKLVYQEEYQNK